MDPRTLRPRRVASGGGGGGGGGAHAEAAAWKTRVVAAGGTVSDSTLAAVSTFCAAIDTAGIRAKFLRLNLFAGTGLAAAMQPLYYSTTAGGAAVGASSDTAVNLVAGDYNETGASSGVKGAAASSKYINTGLPQSNMLEGDNHLSVYVHLTNDYQSLMGCDTSGTAYSPSTVYKILDYGVTSYYGGTASITGTITRTYPTLLVGTRNGTTTTLYSNGTAGTPSTGTQSVNTSAPYPFYLFGTNVGGTLSQVTSNRFNCYSIGLGMNSTQVAAYRDALAAFRTTMGRT